MNGILAENEGKWIWPRKTIDYWTSLILRCTQAQRWRADLKFSWHASREKGTTVMRLESAPLKSGLWTISRQNDVRAEGQWQPVSARWLALECLVSGEFLGASKRVYPLTRTYWEVREVKAGFEVDLVDLTSSLVNVTSPYNITYVF